MSRHNGAAESSDPKPVAEIGTGAQGRIDAHFTEKSGRELREQSVDVVAIDIGQTGARALWLGSDHSGHWQTRRGFRNAETPAAAIADIVRSLCVDLGFDTVRSVAIGMTGLYGEVPSFDGLSRSLRERFSCEELAVADDALTSYLGARGARSGVAVAVGTGVVSLAMDEQGNVWRLGGLGPMLGDEGGGWWIGRHGLLAAISSSDGLSGGSTMLLAEVAARFGSASAAARALGMSRSLIADVARFAEAVIATAQAGDRVSESIVTAAGVHVGDLIMATARRAGLSAPIRYTLLGGISGGGSLFGRAVHARVSANLPGSVQEPADADGLTGALRLIDVEDMERYRGLAWRSLAHDGNDAHERR